MPVTAIVLAGGLGTRLRAIIDDRPKVLAPAAGRPFLDFVLTNLAQQGIKHVRLSTGYLAEQIRAFAGIGEPWGLKISYCEEEIPLGTGGALLKSSLDLDERTFYALNGDTLFLVDLKRLWRIHHKYRPAATIGLRLVNRSDQSQRGCVTLEKDGRIRGFDEKPARKRRDKGEILINGGVYLLERTVFDNIPADTKFSIERELFPQLARQGQLVGDVQPGYFADIGLPQSLDKFEADLHNGVVPAKLLRKWEENESA